MARAQKVKINVLDTFTNTVIYRDISMPDAAKLLKVTYNNVTNSVYRDGLVRSRYKIVKVGFFQSALIKRQLEQPKPKKTYAEAFMERWDDAVEPFRILKRRLGK
jgi:hypothetical protein